MTPSDRIFFQYKQSIQPSLSLESSVYARHPSFFCRCITRALKATGWNNVPKKANLSGLSDNELIGLLMQSDKEAFAAIYDRHAPTLYLHIINQICASTTLEQAQDDTTHILIKVFASLWYDRTKPIIHKTLQEYLLSIAKRKISYYILLREEIQDQKISNE